LRLNKDMKKRFLLLPLVVALAMTGCQHARHDYGDYGGHGHTHEPPHGGTPVVLGYDDFHLEFVRDAEAGKLTAFVLDGHLHNFIRIRERYFEMDVAFNGQEETLTFRQVANPATGETVGDSSQFEAEADWIRTVDEFEAVIRQIDVRSNVYENVQFNFPEGHEVHQH
jgi:hypothetical protein